MPTDTDCIGALLAHATAHLMPHSASARLDACLLLAHSLGASKTWVLTWPEHRVAPKLRAQFEDLVAARARGVPIAYLTCQCEFYSLALHVTEQTLVPRPETEILVQAALDCIPQDTPTRVLELGTGSGAIGLAVAANRPQCTVEACDNSEAALQVARHNAATLNIDNIHFFYSDWYDTIGHKTFDLILSNPPYIPQADPHLMGDIAHEPRAALVSGADGLDALRCLISGCHIYLGAGGRIMLEHGYDQGEAVRALMQHAGLQQITTLYDLAQHARVTCGLQPN